MAINKASQAPVQGGGLLIGNGPSAGGRGPVRPVSRTITDGVTNTDTSLVSASAVFVAGDVGSRVTGNGIPPGTFILTRSSATTVVLSQATTATATAVRVVITPFALGSPKMIHKVSYQTAKVTPTATLLTLSTYEGSITLTGVRTGDIVIAIPPPDFETDAILGGCFVSAADTVKLRITNPTAGSLTMAAKIWAFLWLQMT